MSSDKEKQAKLAADTCSEEERKRKEAQRQALKALPNFLLMWAKKTNGAYGRRLLTPTQHQRLLEQEGRAV